VDTGLFEVDATASHEQVPKLAQETLALLAHLRDEPPSVAELEKAKRRYRWDLEASLDDADAMAGWFGGTSLFFRPASFEEKLARLSQVTPESVREVARQIFRPERLTAVCVGRLGKRRAAELKAIVESF